ncbi:FAD-binding oxidoreductase [Nocardioides sp. KIGAM211]|uniref:FAD-binding oxidoreductase n=1 Tax=Nocardioides luti TaxID=2761101 RepID=A0A7X0RFY9_9ACTN|nr:FAD-dependent oxidoreductase [Nocardioides luti]MBB6627592.1 FAD-binding oxidoreductase [Nocardioides luti]
MSSAETLASADIAVVGAGAAGLCTAWELRRRGFTVAVVEQRFPTYGSSGRNPGCLWIQTRRVGLELALARAGRAKYDDFAAEFGDVFDYRREGGLFFWETEEQGAIMDDYARDRRAAGVEVEVLTHTQAREHTPILPATAIGAVFCAEDAQIDSLGFITAMESACTRAGVQIFRNTTALTTLREGDHAVGVRTVRGVVRASGVVWATGAWASTLKDEGLEVSMSTTRVGQMMMQPVEAQSGGILHGPRGVDGCGALADLPSFEASRFAPPISSRPIADGVAYDDTMALNRGGSLYVGHSIDGRGSLNPHISLESTELMVAAGRDRYPRYSGMGVMGLWAGLGTETADGLPIVGRDDGAYLNVAHAWGVASAPVCAQVLAELITGEDSEFAEGLSPQRAALTRDS